ncbi:MAG TPA: alpha/beta hydrolase [Candidatus Aquilonibacter sp.]|nr:alpha/beta hydrolase [Candidatus Aquilonibacter sp.]
MIIAGHTLDVAQTPPLRANAPTLVFLHEGLGSVALWRDVPAQLAERTGYGTLVYSRYGNGFSDVLREARAVSYMHDEALVALPELLARLQIERPILFGHSDGASIALIYAAAHPHDVTAVVVEAPHVVVEDISVESIAKIGQTYRTTALREKMAKYHADVDATFFGWNDVWLSPGFRSWSIVDRLPSIEAPLLAIQGTDDEYGTLAQLNMLRAHSGGRTDVMVLDRCGHAPHRDRPEIVVSCASAWLSEAASR